MRMTRISPDGRNPAALRVASNDAPTKGDLPDTRLLEGSLGRPMNFPVSFSVGPSPRCFLPAVEPTYSLRLSGRLTVVAPPSPPLSDLPIPLAASPRDLARFPLLPLPGSWLLLCSPVDPEITRLASARSLATSRSRLAARSPDSVSPPRSVP